ncbi:uncharacterized protein [Aristolochia californica]|uniref:uncharacterized protein n=1 Tax=Aristolochia californica TaxID=171875 RepID=UPI0035D6AC38
MLLMAKLESAPRTRTRFEWAFERGDVTHTMAVAVNARNHVEPDCRICAAAGDLLLRLAGGGEQFVGQIGGFSHESEHDLAAMVSEFLESSSSGAESRSCSDSDSEYSDLTHLAEKISFHKDAGQFENDLLAMVQSLILSINEKDLQYIQSGTCNARCIRNSVVKHLQFSGYDAAVCSSKWHGFGKVPGGDHEYIDVVIDGTSNTERMIIDIDFRSHFEIARAVQSYARLLKSLPVVYVGTLTKLRQYLQVMAEAARNSLEQNSMPLPPWRSLAYLQAKWHSEYERKLSQETWSNPHIDIITGSCHRQCIGHLRRLKSALLAEIEADRFLRPAVRDSSNNRRVKIDRWRQPVDLYNR